MQSMLFPALRTELQRSEKSKRRRPKSRKYILSWTFSGPHHIYNIFCPQDFRRCHTLIQRVGVEQGHSFPPSAQKTQYQDLAAKNVQRGLAARVQELSSTFRKKQRVYMERGFPLCLPTKLAGRLIFSMTALSPSIRSTRACD
jgi:hypothetical protein